MQTGNIGVNHNNGVTDDETEGIREKRREPSGLREDKNGMLQDNRHGQNRNDRISYASNTSSDDYVGIEAEDEPLKECGTPFGNCHTTYIPTVETILMHTRDNPHKCPSTIDDMIHTDANIAHQMEMFPPVYQANHNPDIKDSILQCEALAIEV